MFIPTQSVEAVTTLAGRGLNLAAIENHLSTPALIAVVAVFVVLFILLGALMAAVFSSESPVKLFLSKLWSRLFRRNQTVEPYPIYPNSYEKPNINLADELPAPRPTYTPGGWAPFEDITRSGLPFPNPYHDPRPAYGPRSASEVDRYTPVPARRKHSYTSASSSSRSGEGPHGMMLSEKAPHIRVVPLPPKATTRAHDNWAVDHNVSSSSNQYGRR